jgi:hypothetical protein
MSKTSLISGETFKTIGQGALGAMTFGAAMSTDTPKLVMLTGCNNRSYKYISKNRMRFIFLLIKMFKSLRSIQTRLM